jgi:hypothetical protein
MIPTYQPQEYVSSILVIVPPPQTRMREQTGTVLEERRVTGFPAATVQIWNMCDIFVYVTSMVM